MKEKITQIWKEFGWVGLIIAFLVSDGSITAIANLFKGILANGDPSVENALTMVNVFLQTFGLSLGISIGYYIFLKTHNPSPVLYLIILLVTAYLASKLGVGGNIRLPSGGGVNTMITEILSEYFKLYGIVLFTASSIIGFFAGRWAYLLATDE